MILQLIEPTAPPITSTTLSSGIDPLMSGTILAILIYIPIIAWILWRKITGTRLFLEKNNIAQIIRLKKKQIDNEGNIHLGDLSFRILTKPVFLKRWFGFTVPLYKADNDVAVTVNFQDRVTQTKSRNTLTRANCPITAKRPPNAK